MKVRKAGRSRTWPPRIKTRKVITRNAVLRVPTKVSSSAIHERGGFGLAVAPGTEREHEDKRRRAAGVVPEPTPYSELMQVVMDTANGPREGDGFDAARYPRAILSDDQHLDIASTQ